MKNSNVILIVTVWILFSFFIRYTNKVDLLIDKYTTVIEKQDDLIMQLKRDNIKLQDIIINDNTLELTK